MPNQVQFNPGVENSYLYLERGLGGDLPALGMSGLVRVFVGSQVLVERKEGKSRKLDGTKVLKMFSVFMYMTRDLLGMKWNVCVVLHCKLMAPGQRDQRM